MFFDKAASGKTVLNPFNLVKKEVKMSQVVKQSTLTTIMNRGESALLCSLGNLPNPHVLLNI